MIPQMKHTFCQYSLQHLNPNLKYCWQQNVSKLNIFLMVNDNHFLLLLLLHQYYNN